MKIRKGIILLTIFSFFLIVSCTTTTGTIDEYQSGDDLGSTKVITRTSVYTDDKVSIFATYSSKSGQFDVLILNNADSFLKLNYNESAYVSNGISTRVVDGETRRIDSTRTQPSISIPPHSSITRTVCNPESFNAGFTLRDNFSLYLVIEEGENTTYCKLDFKPSEEELEESTLLGSVETSFTLTHWFFTGNTKSEVAQRLLKEAVAQYGYDASTLYLKDIQYTGTWQPTSLLLYFDFFGYVEKVTASADVYVRVENN